MVGKFGYVDVKLPLILPLAWFALFLALGVSAWMLCDRRERILLALVLAVGLLGPVAFYALFIRPTGFGLQGRHVLPALVALPLLAGEAVYKYRDRAGPHGLGLLVVAIPVACGAMQLVAWYVDAKRYAVGGSGPEWFLDRAAWTPPTGWWTWLVAAALGGICLGALVLANRKTTSHGAFNAAVHRDRPHSISA